MAAEPYPTLNWVLYRPLRNVRGVFTHVTDPAVAFLATSDGLYRSDDEGKNFKPVESASAEKLGVVTTMAFSPANERVFLAGTDEKGLFISADGGATWTRLGAADSKPASSSEEKVASKPAAEHVEWVDFDPADPSWRTIIASHGTAAVGLSISRDLGATWAAFGTDRYFRAFTKRGASIIAVGSMARTEGREWGLHRSGTDALRWEESNRGIRPSESIAATSDWRFYAATLDGEMLNSDDDGRTWRVGSRTEGASWVSFFWTRGRTAADDIYVAYDPYVEGVTMSNRRFAPGGTVKNNEGLYVGSFVRSGAACRANANGSVYYVVMSNALWVGRRTPDKNGPDIAQAWCRPGCVWVDQAAVNASHDQLHQRIERVASSGVRPDDVRAIADAQQTISSGTAGMRFHVLARVNHPKGLDAIKTVSTDAAPVGGPATVPMFDDGRHEDEKAGDGIWGGLMTFPPTLFEDEAYQRRLRPNRTTAVTVTATDSAGAKASWSAAVSLQARPGSIVIFAGSGAGGVHEDVEGPVTIQSARDEGLGAGTAALGFLATGPGPWRGTWICQKGSMRTGPIDISGRQSVSFYIKGSTDQDVYVQIVDRHALGEDVFDEPHHSKPVHLVTDGYLQHVTPSYQKVTMPMAKLLPPGTLFLREFGAGIAVGVGEGGKPGKYYVDQVRFDP